MDYKYIEQLMERYWNCETTLEEEAILKAFFSQNDVPAELAKYKSLFDCVASDKEENVLGDDFDARMEALIDEPVKVKARVVPFRQRLMPLFKAAAMVAIILTLGNASQFAFHEEDDDVATTVSPKVHNGPGRLGENRQLEEGNRNAQPTEVRQFSMLSHNKIMFSKTTKKL